VTRKRAGMSSRRAAGRGGGSAPLGDPVVGVMCLAVQVAVWLMPLDAGRRWKAEVASFLAECDPEQQRAASWSWVCSAPWLIVVMWGAELARRARGVGNRGPVSQPPRER
jgi:hypothetical protein